MLKTNVEGSNKLLILGSDAENKHQHTESKQLEEPFYEPDATQVAIYFIIRNYDGHRPSCL